MSNATPSDVTANGNCMDRVEPHDENPGENARNWDEGSVKLKEKKPSWFCKLVASKPLSIFGMLLCL
jgi:hypothetical protein